MSRLCLLALLALLAAVALAVMPSVTKKSYNYRDAKVLRSPTTHNAPKTREKLRDALMDVPGIFDVEFDQDIHRVYGTSVCSNMTQCAPVSACPPCDYRDPLVCSGAIRGANTTCPCTKTIACEPYSDFANDPTFPKSLNVGDKVELYMPPGTAHEFRVFVNFTGRECSYLWINLSPHWGDPDLYIASAALYHDDIANAPYNFNSWGEIWGNEDWVYCPSTPTFESGTFVVGLFSFDSQQFATGVGSSFTLEVQLRELPGQSGHPSPAPCSIPPALQATHSCLQDNVVTVLNFSNAPNASATEKGDTLYFTYEVPASTANVPTTIYRDTNTQFFSSWTNPFPTPIVHPPRRYAPLDDPQLFQQVTQGMTLHDTFSVWLDEPKVLYVSALKLIENPPGPYIFMTQYWRDWSMLLTSSSLTQFQYTIFAHATSRMRCRYGGSEAEEDFHCFRKISDYEPTDCFFYYPLPPIPDPNPFYPRPAWSVAVAKWQRLSWLEGQNTTMLDRRYSAALTLSYQIEATDTPVLRLNGSVENLATCEMSFMGNLANSDWEIFLPRDPIKFEHEELTDKNDTFKDVQKTIEKYLEQLNDVKLEGQQLADVQYQIDILEFSRPFQAALDLTRSLFTTTPRTINQVSTECVTKNSTDPCCEGSIGWTGKPCLPRRVTLQLPTYSATTDAIHDRCGVPKSMDGVKLDDSVCTTNAVQDFSSFAASDSINSCAKSGLPEEYIIRSEMQPYRQCRDKHLGAGVDLDRPTPCAHDSDCVPLAGADARCDVRFKTCLIPERERFNNFMSCLLTELDQFIVFKIAEERGVRVVDSPAYLTNANLWTNSTSGLYKGSDCVDPQGYRWAFPHRYHWNLRPDTTTIKCPHCLAPNCFDEFCTLPYECNVRFKTSCYQSWHEEGQAEGNCKSEKKCSWNVPEGRACLNGTSGNPTAEFCHVCDNGADCLAVPAITSESECSSTICFNNDGAITVEANAAACSARMSCDQRLNGVVVTNQTVCENEAGICGNADWFVVPFLEGVAASAYPAPGSAVGAVCILPKNPFRLPECAKVGTTQRPVSSGCLDYGITTEAACTVANGTWVNRPTTRAECEAFGSVCRRPLDQLQVKDYFNDVIATEQGRDDCLLYPNATWTPRFQWISGTWRAGQARTGVWRLPSETERWQWSNSTFNMKTLHDDLLEAIQAKIRFQRKSYSFCRFGRYVPTLASISCACNDPADVSACYASQSATDGSDNVAAVTDVCGGADATISASPVSANFSTTSLAPFGLCDTVRLLIQPALAFKSTEASGTATYFIDFSENTDFTFRNDQDALIGQVIGDGVGIQFNATSLIRIEQPVTFCTLRRTDIIELQDEDYIILDFARVSGEDLTPLEIEVIENEDSGQICATFLPDNGVIYMPVLRRTGDYKAIEREVFTSGEIIMVSIVIVSYIGILVFAAWKLHPLVLIRQFHFGVGVCIPLVLLYIVRLLYFILLFAGAINVNATNVGIFILIELPVMLYFSTTCYFVVNWAFVTRTIKRLGPAKNLRPKIIKAFAGFNVGLFLVFLTFILAFAFAVPAPYELCSGRVVVVDNTTAKTISLVYRLLMGILAFVLGLGFMIFGTQLYCSVKDAKFATDKFKRTIYMQSALCSVSLVVEAIFLVCIATIPDYNSTDYANILSMAFMLICEILPGIAILYFLDLKQLQKAADTTRTSASTTGGKAAMKSMYDTPGPSNTGSTGGSDEEAVDD